MTTPNEWEKVIAEMHHHVEHDGCACCRTKDWADRLASEQREAQPEAPVAVGEYLCNVDEHGGIRWIGARPPHGTKLYTTTPAPVDVRLREVLRLLDNVTASTDTEADYLGQAENMLRNLLSGQHPAPVDVRKLQRWKYSPINLGMYENDNGEWVKYSDVLTLLSGQQAGVDANYHVRAHSDRMLGEAGWMVLDDPVGFMRYPANFDYRVTYTAALGGEGRGE